MNMIGMAITKPLLYGAAAIVLLLLGVIGAQAVGLKYLDGKLDDERARYSALEAKNGRCEAEAGSTKTALATQTEAVKDWKRQAEANAEIARKAQEEAAAARRGSDKKIADILAGKPVDPTDLCKSAMHELRLGIRR